MHSVQLKITPRWEGLGEGEKERERERERKRERAIQRERRFSI